MILFLLFAAVLFFALLPHYPYFFQDVCHVCSKLCTRRRVTKNLQTNYAIIDRFSHVVGTQPNKPFVYFKEECFTYKQADKLSNKTARVFLQSGLRMGDTVALFLQNGPMFVWLWLGLAKLGCVGAFINYNIRSKSLLHSFKISGAKTLVAAEGKHK